MNNAEYVSEKQSQITKAKNVSLKMGFRLETHVSISAFSLCGFYN
jgi:hypothetical protein